MTQASPNSVLGKRTKTRETGQDGVMEPSMADHVVDDAPEDMSDSDSSTADVEAPIQLDSFPTIVSMEENSSRRSTFSFSLDETGGTGATRNVTGDQIGVEGGHPTPESPVNGICATTSQDSLQSPRLAQVCQEQEVIREGTETRTDEGELESAEITPDTDNSREEMQTNDGTGDATASPVKDERSEPAEGPHSINPPSIAPDSVQPSPVAETSPASLNRSQLQVSTEQPAVMDGLGDSAGPVVDGHQDDDIEMSKDVLELEDLSSMDSSKALDVTNAEGSIDEELTEASLQLEMERDMATSEADQEPSMVGIDGPQVDPVAAADVLSRESEDSKEGLTERVESSPESDVDAVTEVPVLTSVQLPLHDIADGLTLTPSVSTPAHYRTMELASPTRAATDTLPDETTTTMSLDDDTALLKDFLNRAAANKANKVAIIARRSSLQNRRDSDAVRQALASPRKILEDKDPNSPAKYDADATLDLTQTLTLNMAPQPPLSPTLAQVNAEPEAPEETQEKTAKSSRRSSRTRKSRLPAPPTAAEKTATPAGMPKNISVRRVDGGEPIVLKKTETQQLSLLTRTNTRKNKQGAVCVSIRLLKLSKDEENNDTTTTSTIDAAKSAKKSVHWHEQLAHYQDDPRKIADALAEAESLATPDELSGPVSTPSVKKKVASKDKKTGESSRMRKGTPGKGLLAPASLLPDGVVTEEKTKDAAPAEKSQRGPKSKLKKLAVASAPSSETASPKPAPPAPAQDETKEKPATAAAKERKSRLATPRKVKLPVPVPAVPADGKENQQQTRSIAGITPKKRIKLSEALPPPVSVQVESGLPRRRPVRKV